MDKADRQKPGESKPSKLQEQLTEFTSAWDERRRHFDRLRDLNLTDDARKAALADYKAASENFDKLRTAALK